MGRRYEAEDQQGRRVWLQDGIEAYETDNGIRVCIDPANPALSESWIAKTFATPDEAFSVAMVIRDMRDDKQ